MAPTDPPVVNIQKALRDVVALHRRLSWVPDSDEVKLRLVALKEEIIRKYEELGGKFGDKKTFGED